MGPWLRGLKRLWLVGGNLLPIPCVSFFDAGPGAGGPGAPAGPFGLCCPFMTTNNLGGTPGQIEPGDSVTVTVDAWNGPTGPIFVKLRHNASPTGQDGLWFCQAGAAATNFVNCGAGTHADDILGSIDLGSKGYVTGTVVFNANLSFDGNNTITVTIGPCVSGCDRVRTGGASKATFLPNGVTGTRTPGVPNTETSSHF
jgi:hypothetical protein